MARGIKKLKKWTTISLLLSSARYSRLALICQTLQERILTQQQRDRHNQLSSTSSYPDSYRPFGYCVMRFREAWGDAKLSLQKGWGVHRDYKLVLDTPSKRYARGRVVFKNEDSDA